MSDLTNDQIKEQKLEAYEEYLHKLDDEFLLYEFNDRIGCDPETLYINSKYVTDKEKWIEDLLDNFSCELLDNLELDWINKNYLEGLK